jgi:hypothetical protein
MDSEYPRTTVPADATLRNAFNHFGLQCLGPVLILCLVILRQVKTSPGEPGVLLQDRRTISNQHLATERAPIRPLPRLDEVVPHGRAGRIDYNPVMGKHF